MSETPIFTTEPTLHGKNSKTDGISSANTAQNITPPIDAVPTSAALDGTPKKRNHLPWILGISALIVIFFTSLLILSGNQKKIEKNPAEIDKLKAVPTTSFQNNWKTYSSNNYGFSLSFSYPSDWEISEIGGYGRQPGEYDSLLLKAPYTQQELVERKNINLTEEKNYVFMTIHDFPKTAYIPKTNEFEKVSQKEILIDSLSATEYQIEVTENPQPPVESPYPAGTSYTVIYIVHNGGYLVLEHVDKDKPEIFQQILSTFKFIDAQDTILSETPVTLSDPKLVEFVRSYLKMGAEIQFKIEKVEGDYAYGTGGAENTSGFYWAAAKKDGQWNYTFGGNGIPECKEVEIFPVGTFKLVGQGGKFDDCYNDKSELIDRKTGFLVK